MTKTTPRGKLDAGNPHVRLDEGKVAPSATPRRGSLLYKTVNSQSTCGKIAALAVVATISFAASAADWTQSGGTEASPLDLSTLSGLPDASTGLSFKIGGSACVTNGLADAATVALCGAISLTTSDSTSYVTFLGDLVFNGSFSGNYGSALKRGDWKSTEKGNFILGNGPGTFAFTNETGSITVPYVDGTLSSKQNGSLQLGYGNNSSATYCHNGGKATFNQMQTGYSSGASANNGINSQNHVIVNGGELEIAGWAAMGYKNNKTWVEVNGGKLTLGNKLYIGNGAKATNYWSQTAGETSVADAAYIGYAANTMTWFEHSGGTATFNGTFNTGNSAGATAKCEFGGGTVTFNGLTHIGQAANNTNYWRQTGGEVHFSEASFILGYGAGLKVEAFHTGGVLTVDRSLWLSWGDSAANDVYFEVSGGVVTNAYDSPNFRIGAEGQAGSRAEMKVTGTGKVHIAGPCSVGVNGAGTLTIDGNGLFETDPATRAVVICNGTLAADEDCYINLDGGTLLTAGIDYGINSSSVDGHVTFNGGTLKATASPVEGNFIDNDSRLKVRVGENGGTIDTSLASVTIPCDISGVAGTSGGLTFKGGNSVTVTGRISYTGATTVEVGTTLTVADRANVFDTGAGLVCLVSDPSAAETQHALLTTSGDDPFTAADLAKCSASGYGNVKFTLSGDGKSICAKAIKGLIISIY